MTNEKIIKALDNIYGLLIMDVIKGDDLRHYSNLLMYVLYPKIKEDNLKPFVTRYIETLLLVSISKMDVELSQTEISNK